MSDRSDAESSSSDDDIGLAECVENTGSMDSSDSDEPASPSSCGSGSGNNSDATWSAAHDITGDSGSSVHLAGEQWSGANSSDFQRPHPSRSTTQRILVALLAKVCAQADPTPKLFAVTCVHLYQAGILDSLHFLNDVAGASRFAPEIQTYLPSIAHDTPLPGPPSLDPLPFIQSLMSGQALARRVSRASPVAFASSRYSREFEQLPGQLGQGGFGRVFTVRNRVDGALYAVKRIVFKDKLVSESVKNKVFREVSCLAQLDHKNIVRYYSAWVEPLWLEESTLAKGVDLDAGLAQHAGQPLLIQDAEGKQDSMSDIFTRGSSAGLSDGRWSEDSNTRASQNGGNSSVVRMALYVQMALCSARTLRDWLDATKVVSVPSVVAIFQQLLSALDHVHSRKIIHRDLKPSNCFIAHDGTLKLGDFGLSKSVLDATVPPERKKRGKSVDLDDHDSGDEVVEIEAPQDSPKPRSNPDYSLLPDALLTPRSHTSAIGTRSYASPEQLNGTEYDEKSDMFSLGLILLELLNPFHTGMERAMAFVGVRDDHRLPADVESKYPQLAEVVHKLVSPDPCNRPSAADLLSGPLFVGSQRRSMTMAVPALGRGCSSCGSPYTVRSLSSASTDDSTCEECSSLHVTATPTPRSGAGIGGEHSTLESQLKAATALLVERDRVIQQQAAELVRLRQQLRDLQTGSSSSVDID